MESVCNSTDKAPLLHHHSNYQDVSVTQVGLALIFLFVVGNLVRDIYWRYHKRYPPIASWLWVPFLGHLPCFLIAPHWFIRRAYKNSRGKPFVFDMMAYRFVICGRSETETMFRSKEDLLESEAAIMKLTNFDLTLGTDLFQKVHSSGMTANTYVVRKYFTPNMNDHVRPMVEEVLGVAHAWYERSSVIEDIETFVLEMVAAAASRALLGKKLSSNPVLAKEMREFSAKVQEVMKLTAVMPRSKLLGPAEKVSEAKEIIARILIPEIRERRQRMKEGEAAAATERSDAKVEKPAQQEEPKNFLDYVLLQTELDGTPLTDERICNCLYAMIFGAYDTTTHATVHLLYDIAGRPQVKAEVLREQEDARKRYLSSCSSAREETPGSSLENKPVDPIGYLSIEAIKSMNVLEMALRESQRLSASVFGPLRMVMKEGMTLKDGLTVLPQGSIMTLSPWLLHHDPSIYKNPSEYQLNRFEEESKKSFPSMSKFLNFGGGKHHCPGRFFATLEIKCIVSALLSRFEISASGPAPYTYDNGSTIIKREAVPIRLKYRISDTDVQAMG